MNKYYSIDTNDVVSFAAEIDTSGLDEIVLVQAKDAEAAARVEEKLQARYDSRSKEIASYSPENYEIMKKGYYPMTLGTHLKYTVLDPIEPKGLNVDELTLQIENLIKRELGQEV